MKLKMPAIPSQWQFSEIMKLFIDLANAQWVDGSGVGEQQDALDLFEHLSVQPKKMMVNKIHTSGSLMSQG